MCGFYWFFITKLWILFYFSIYPMMKQPIIFELLFVNFCWGIIRTTLGIFSIDFLFYLYGSVLSELLHSLKEQFKESANNNQKLRTLIIRHRKIIDCCELLRKIYLPMLISQYIFFAITLTFLAFQIITVSGKFGVKFD